MDFVWYMYDEFLSLFDVIKCWKGEDVRVDKEENIEEFDDDDDFF